MRKSLLPILLILLLALLGLVVYMLLGPSSGTVPEPNTWVPTGNQTEGTQIDQVSVKAGAVGPRRSALEVLQGPFHENVNSFRVRIVLEITKEPVPGAEVSYVPMSVSTRLGPAEQEEYDRLFYDLERLCRRFGATVLADEEGRAFVPAEGFIRVAARKGDLYGETAQPLDPKDDKEHVIELEEDQTLVVRVQDSLGRPAVGVPMGIVRGSQDQETNYRTQPSQVGFTEPPDGILRWTHLQNLRRTSEDLHLAPVGFLLRPLIPGFVEGGEALDLEVLVDPPEEPLLIRLPPTGRVVVHRANARGEPLRDAGATVTLAIHSGSNEQWMMTVRHAEAVAAFEWVVAGRDYIASSDVFGRVNETFTGPQRQDHEVHVVLSRVREVYELVGRALNERTEPLSDTQLRFGFEWIPGINSSTRSVRTDGGGYFRVPVDGPGREMTLTKLLIERVPEQNETEPLTLIYSLAKERSMLIGDNDLGDVVLGRGNVVAAGRVLVNGEPFRGALDLIVEAEIDPALGFPPSFTRKPILTTRFFDGGRFQILGDLEPGPYSLYINDTGAALFLPGEPIEFAPGAENLQIDLDSGGSLRAELLVDLNYSDLRNLEVFLVDKEGNVPGPEGNPLLRRLRFGGPNQAPVPQPTEGKCVLTWSALWPGMYDFEVRSRGARQPLVTISNVRIVSGEENEDPRLLPIDLRGKLPARRQEH